MIQQTGSFRSLYRRVAKAVHPDLTLDNEDRAKHQALMADVNLAYKHGNARRLRQILKNAEPPNETKPPKVAKPSKELPRGIRRRGNSLVIFLTHPDGTKERRSVGNITVAMAVKLRGKWQLELAEEKYVPKVPRVEIPTFAVLADAMLQWSKNYKRSWDSDAGRLKKMKMWWADLPANELTKEAINDKLLNLTTPNGALRSKSTSNEYRVLILKIYDLAMDQEDKKGKPVYPSLIVNPAKKAFRYKLKNERSRVLSNDEETRLRAAIVKLYPSKMPEFDLSLHTGARRSNFYGIHGKGRTPMAGLEWKDVDVNFLCIRFPRSKSGDPYTVPFNQVAHAALTVLRERSDGEDGPVIRKASGREIFSKRKWFENCLAEAKISNLHWHDLRHTFATRLRANRVDVEDIQVLLGHTPINKMTTRYANANLELLRQAVATLVPKPTTQSDTKSDTGTVTEIRVAQAG